MAKQQRSKKAAPTMTDDVPPGATRRALDRPTDMGGTPGSGGGPRHAAGDEGSEIESTGRTDTNQPLAEAPFPDEDPLEQGPPYAGSSGGAVGGSPAQRRSSGGRTHRGIAPGGVHRGDSTIGTDPRSGTD